MAYRSAWFYLPYIPLLLILFVKRKYVHMFLETSHSFCSKSFREIYIYIYDKYRICLWKVCCLLPHDSAALSQVSLSSLVPCDLTRLLKGMSHVFALCRGSY